MKKNYLVFFVLLLLAAALFTKISEAQVTVSGAHASSNGSYGTLGAAFNAINGQTQTGFDIIVAITSSTTESSSAQLNQGSWATLKIYPTGVGGYTINSNTGGVNVVDLIGADNVTIDGRVNQVPGPIALTIQHTVADGTSTVIRFVESAENNTIQYCNIKGSNTGTTYGIIYFGYSSNGNGNDGNTITNCNMTNYGGSRPVNIIYSQGSTGYVNSGNIISNNNLYDYKRSFGSSIGINILNNNSSWTISQNSFYETADLTTTTSGTNYAIRINETAAGGDGFIISENYIGGKAALCGGGAYTVDCGTTTTSFTGIGLNGGTTNASSIQGNIIKNINMTNTSNPNPFYGINVTGGKVNIGTITGNEIGSSSGTGSITISGSQTTSMFSRGIYVSLADISEAANITNNTIGSVTLINTNSTSGHCFRAIESAGGGTSTTATISNNSVGSTVTPNSIQTTSACTGGGNFQSNIGIQSAVISGSMTISGNTISNFYNAATGSQGGTGTYGINAQSSGYFTIQNNTIFNLSTSCANTNVSDAGAVIGIWHTATKVATHNVNGNTIYNLSNTHGTAAVSVCGIYYQGPTSATANTTNIYSNFIHTLSISSNSASAVLKGIQIINSGSASTNNVRNVYNNIINIGNGITNNCIIYGIYEYASGTSNRTNNYYFNTVYIGGTVSSSTAKTYGYYRSTVATHSTVALKNNVFFNARSNSVGTGKHFAIGWNAITNLTMDYNDYFANGTGGVLGDNVGVDITSLPNATLGNNSLNVDPIFPDPDANGLVWKDFAIGNEDLSGVGDGTTGIITDFSGWPRGNPPSIGGIQYDNPLPVTLKSFSYHVRNRNINLNWITEKEQNNAGFNVERKLIESDLWLKVGFVSGSGTKNTPTNYSFDDKNLNTGKYRYRLKQIDNNGNFEYHNLNGIAEIGIPAKINLSQNYPNPFNPVTKINFDIPKDSRINITVFDVSGRNIKTLLNEHKNAGYHTAQFDASGLSSGVYYCRLQASGFSSIIKMTLLK